MGFRVAFTGVLNVHGNVVDQTGFDELAQLLGKAAVGVELDGKAAALDRSAECGYVRLQKRLATRDADAVEQALALVEKREELVLGN